MQKEGCLLHKGQGEKKMLDAQRGVVSFIVLKKAEYSPPYLYGFLFLEAPPVLPDSLLLGINDSWMVLAVINITREG